MFGRSSKRVPLVGRLFAVGAVIAGFIYSERYAPFFTADFDIPKTIKTARRLIQKYRARG